MPTEITLRLQINGEQVRRILPAHRSLLDSEHPRFWLYRSNQAAACGDFVIVDLSAPDPRRRRVWIVALKLGAALRRGGGPAGWQLRCAAAAVDELVARRVVAEPSFSLWSGDSAAVLTALGGG